MNEDRTLIFNGQILADSASPIGKYEGFENENLRKFKTREELLAEMDLIGNANVSMGLGKILDAGDITDRNRLIRTIDSVSKNQLLLVRTRYSTVGNIDAFERFTAHISQLPGLVMVGIYSDEEPDAHPFLIW